MELVFVNLFYYPDVPAASLTLTGVTRRSKLRMVFLSPCEYSATSGRHSLSSDARCLDEMGGSGRFRANSEFGYFRLAEEMVSVYQWAAGNGRSRNVL